MPYHKSSKMGKKRKKKKKNKMMKKMKRRWLIQTKWKDSSSVSCRR